MKYCYSGTESLWYGSCNRYVCRKGKCAADRPSRWTEVNPGRKQRCCSPSCLWSRHSFCILFYHFYVFLPSTDMVNWFFYLRVMLLRMSIIDVCGITIFLKLWFLFRINKVLRNYEFEIYCKWAYKTDILLKHSLLKVSLLIPIQLTWWREQL